MHQIKSWRLVQYFQNHIVNLLITLLFVISTYLISIKISQRTPIAPTVPLTIPQAVSPSCQLSFDVIIDTPTLTPIPTQTPTQTITLTPTPPLVCVDKPTDIVLALDRSGSMGTNGVNGRLKLEWEKDAAILLIQAFQNQTPALQQVVRVGVVSWAGNNNLVSTMALTNNWNNLITYIQGITYQTNDQYTCLECGITDAGSLLTDPSRQRAIIFLSDGIGNRIISSCTNTNQNSCTNPTPPTCDNNAAYGLHCPLADTAGINAAASQKSLGVQMFVVGYGSRINPISIMENNLNDISSGAGYYQYGGDESSWGQLFLNIADALCFPPTITPFPTWTITPTMTQTGTPTQTVTPTLTLTQTITPTPTITPTDTLTITPTITLTPTPPTTNQCLYIKLYKDDIVVDPANLYCGDHVVLAVKGTDQTTKAHFRINGAQLQNDIDTDPNWTESTRINTNGEYEIEYTIPCGISYILIEAEIYADGIWY
jgi:hypothetical protein